jgi:ribose transport system permease protein
MNSNTNSGMNSRIIGASKSALSLQKAFLAIVLVVIAMALFNLIPATRSEFFSQLNLVDLVKSSSIFIMLAMGETVVLIAGGVDLSIGGMMALSGVVVIMLMNAGVPIPVAIALTLLLGLVVGAINAFISVYQRTEPFIITLGMGIALTGIGQQLTNAHPVSSTDPVFQNLANLEIFGPIPILVVVMLAVLAVIYWVLRNTSFGRNVYAVGGDYEVAKYSGIDVRRTKAATYLICGLTAALGGVMLASQLSSASSIVGENTALYVVCAVVVGGTSVAGGIGGAIKSTIGLVLLGLLTNAFNMLRIDSLVSYLPTALLGIIIVTILWLDSYGRKRKREAV